MTAVATLAYVFVRAGECELCGAAAAHAVAESCASSVARHVEQRVILRLCVSNALMVIDLVLLSSSQLAVARAVTACLASASCHLD